MPVDYATQRKRLEAIGPGWLDGEGEPIDRPALDAMIALLDAIAAAGWPLASLYPVPDGSVRAEWNVGAVEISLERSPEGAWAGDVHDTLTNDFVRVGNPASLAGSEIGGACGGASPPPKG